MADGKPRISINKLAEYCEATTSRRKKIVQNAIDPQPFVVTWYGEARKAIKEFLILDDEDKLSEAIDSIGDLPIESDFQQNNYALSIEAVEAVQETDLSKLEGLTFEEYNRKENVLIELAGVDVSVNPDLIIRKGDQIGALKIHIKKNGLSDEGLKKIAVVLHKYLEDHVIAGDQTATSKICFSFDVFTEQLISAPTSFKRRLQEIEDACTEYALWWATL